MIDVFECLKKQFLECSRCKLAGLGRTQVVFGVGNTDADLMIIGEAPGLTEDTEGKPFVGRSGKLLTNILKELDVDRDSIYVSNIVKCRPPNNRNPEKDEIDTCNTILSAEINIVRPKVIIALGTFASQTILQTTERISAIRGKKYPCWLSHKLCVDVIPTFHPSYILKNASKKEDFILDLKQALRIVRRSNGQI